MGDGLVYNEIPDLFFMGKRSLIFYWVHSMELEMKKSLKDLEMDLEKRLQEFKGIGQVTTNIFLRELRVAWHQVAPSPGSRLLFSLLCNHNLFLYKKVPQDELKLTVE